MANACPKRAASNSSAAVSASKPKPAPSSKKMRPSVLSAANALGASMTGAGRERNSISQTMEITLGGVKRAVHVLIDSGAELNFISQKVIAEQGLSAISSSIRAHAVDGHEVQVYGEHDITVHACDLRGVRRSYS